MTDPADIGTAAIRSQAHPAVLNALRDLAGAGGVWITVNGQCMTPRLRDGDRVLVTRCRCYLPGDVLAFRAWDGRLLVHRLLGYRLRGIRFELVTAADSAVRSDVPIPIASVIGRVVDCDPAAATPLVTGFDRRSALRRFLVLAWQRLRGCRR